MSRYSNIVYGSYLYGPDSTAAQGALPAYRVDPMLVKSVEFGKIIVGWKDAVSTYTQAKLVRSQDGFPMSPDDGVAIWSRNYLSDYAYNVAHGTGEDSFSRSYLAYTSEFDSYRVFVDGHFDDVLDSNGTVVKPAHGIELTPGKPVYYKMFLFVDSGSEKYWVEAGKVYTIMPSDHGMQESLTEILPKVFTSPGKNPLDVVDPTSDLYKFLGGLSYTLEELMTFIDLLMPSYSQEYTPAQAIPLWRNSLGLSPEPVLGVKNQKALIREALYCYSHKGTALGLGSYIESLTGFSPEITVNNLMPSMQDSTFYQGLGNWVVTNATLALDTTANGTANNPAGTVPFAGDSTYTAKVTATTAGMMTLGLGTLSVSQGIPVTPGKTYTLSFQAKFSSGTGGITPVVSFYNYKGEVLNGVGGSSIPSTATTWTLGTVTSAVAPKQVTENVVRAVRVSTTQTRYYAYPTTSMAAGDVVTIQGFGVASLDVSGKTVASVDSATNSFVLTVPSGSVPSGTDVTALATASNASQNAVYASVKLSYSNACTFFVDMFNFQEGSSTTYHEARSIDLFLNPTATNYVKNPSFETNVTDGWSYTGLTPAQDTTIGQISPTGNKSAKITGSGAWTFYTEYTPASTDPVWKSSTGKNAATSLNNRYWTASAYIKSDVATTLTLATVGGTAVTATTSVAAGDWARYTVSLLVPNSYVDGTKLRLTIGGTSGTTYVDCVQLQVGHLATEYFDGSLPVGTFGVVWEGTPANSYSHQYVNKLAAIGRLRNSLKEWVPRGSFGSISVYGGTNENGVIDLT